MQHGCTIKQTVAVVMNDSALVTMTCASLYGVLMLHCSSSNIVDHETDICLSIYFGPFRVGLFYMIYMHLSQYITFKVIVAII